MNSQLQNCSAEDCSTLSAHRFCARHRRLLQGWTISAAERARRKQEELDARDPLFETMQSLDQEHRG
jgi:hypothetical protein